MSIFPGSIVPAGTQSQQALVMARQTEFVICNQSIYHYFRLWRIDGRWEELNGILSQRLRVRMGREATPSGSIIDSQSAKTTEKGDPEAMTAARK
jgi:transposase